MGCRSSKKAVDDPTAKEPFVKAIQGNEEDIRDKYVIGKLLGSGSFGQVYEAALKEYPTEIRAVKMIERDNDDGEWSNRAIFVREVGLLQQIKHENIIRYYDVYEDLHFLYVVMELCKGGEVFGKILELKRFSERNAAIIGEQMLKAIAYMHLQSIAHRDIKAENFMLAEPPIHSSVKMIDFGMATKYAPDEVLTELCGSPHYLAPELIGQKYNHLADIWAFGVLMYLLMYGHYPHDAKHPRDIMVKILTEPIAWKSEKAKMSKDCTSFLKKCLEHNAKKRIAAEDALLHPWIKNLTSGLDEGEALPTEVIRSAHKKLTATRKPIDGKVEKQRMQKLQAIDEDFSKGIRHGQRLGETPKEEFMAKPEYLRRDNKLTTAPSTNTSKRRSSMQQMIHNLQFGNKTKTTDSPGGLTPLPPLSEMPEAGSPSRKGSAGKDTLGPLGLPVGTGGTRTTSTGGRSASVSGVSSNPRRLSYLGGISNQEEQNLANLFEEKKKPMMGILPETGLSSQTTLPGTAIHEDDSLQNHTLPDEQQSPEVLC